MNLAYLADLAAPARRVVDSLPTKHTVTDFTSPATAASLAELEQKFSKPSTRTYYLGTNGRVSQRKQLVGEVLATTRAYTTNMAWSQFKRNFYDLRKVERNLPEPFIGKATTCSRCSQPCGHTHTISEKVVCHVCANWASLAGSVQTAPETLAERGVVR
jgi:hypothetical protein